MERVGRLEMDVDEGAKRGKKTRQGDRMAQRNRDNLPEERRMAVVGLVEALKLEVLWLDHI